MDFISCRYIQSLSHNNSVQNVKWKQKNLDHPHIWVTHKTFSNGRRMEGRENLAIFNATHIITNVSVSLALYRHVFGR